MKKRRKKQEKMVEKKQKNEVKDEHWNHVKIEI